MSLRNKLFKEMFSIFAVVDPTQHNPQKPKNIDPTQPNPLVNPTHGQLYAPTLERHFGIAQSVRLSVPWRSCLGVGTLAACSLATAGQQRCADCGPVRGRR